MCIPSRIAALGFRGARMARAFGPLKTHYVFWGKNVRLPGTSAPPIFALPFSVEAEVEIPQGGARMA